MGGPFGYANASTSKKKPTLVGARFSQAKVMRRGWISYQLSPIPYRLSSLRLLEYFFKLCSEHVHASIGIKIPAKRNVKPVSFLALHGEFVCFRNGSGVRRVSPGLRNKIDEEVPSTSLSYLSRCPRDGLLLLF